MTRISQRLREACGYENVTPSVRSFDSGASNGLVLDAADMLDECEKALEETDRLSLVIESAVRNADKPNHEAVLAALKANRATLATLKAEEKGKHERQIRD